MRKLFCMLLAVVMVLSGCGDSKTTTQSNNTSTSNSAEEQKAEETATEEEVAEASKNPTDNSTYGILFKYLSDDDFTDWQDFGWEVGANDLGADFEDHQQIGFVFGDWLIELSTDAFTVNSYIAVGKAYEQDLDYVWFMSNTGGSAYNVFDDAKCDQSVLDVLPEVIDYCRRNPYSTTAPSISGAGWKTWEEVKSEFE